MFFDQFVDYALKFKFIIFAKIKCLAVNCDIASAAGNCRYIFIAAVYQEIIRLTGRRLHLCFILRKLVQSTKTSFLYRNIFPVVLVIRIPYL